MDMYDMEENSRKCLKVVIYAARILMNNDSDRYNLLEKSRMERSIEFIFAYHIKNLLNIKEIDVDCEYNKNLEDIKKIGVKCEHCFYEYDCYYRKIRDHYQFGKQIIPDILIHRRQSIEDDLAVIEIKHHRNLYSVVHPAFKNDFQKLSYMTCTNSEFKYQLGLEVVFTRNNVYFLIFKDGKMLFDKYKSLKEMEEYIQEGEKIEKY